MFWGLKGPNDRPGPPVSDEDPARKKTERTGVGRCRTDGGWVDMGEPEENGRNAQVLLGLWVMAPGYLA